MKKKIAVLGSTGSIGTQALEVIGNHPEEFELYVIAAWQNVDLLIEQAIKFLPQYVVIGSGNKYQELKDALFALPVKVLAGYDSIVDVAALPEIDVVLTAMVGFSGLKPTISALKAGKTIALANKETLVVAGELINSIAKEYNCKIYPVDSEHSAIFQCLIGESNDEIEKIYLTASGGPFRGKKKEELVKISRKEALLHPNWCMGDKITIDSATLMNKGLEAIEAKWLFGVNPKQIEVIVHPQSIIHSMVQFKDGSIKAQMGLPDMRLPIQYALGYPGRLKSDFKRFNFSECSGLTFEKPDISVFRNLELAFYAMNKGGNLPCIMNAANEEVVGAFLKDNVGFLEMTDIIEEVMGRMKFHLSPSFEDYCECDCETRELTRELLNR